METRKSYTCEGCGYRSSWPLSAEEIAECARRRYEHQMNRLRMAIIVIAAIAVPMLISMLLACL